MQRHSWRQYLRDALRPEGEPQAVRPGRRAVAFDIAVAVLLCAAALVAIYHLQVGAQVVPGPGPAAPVPVPPPVAPLPLGPRVPVLSVPLAVEPQQVVLGVLSTLPLVLRRRWPLVVFWVVVGATLSDPLLTTRFTLLACGIAVASVVLHSRNLVPAMGSFVLAAVLTGSAFRDSSPAATTTLVAVLALGLLAALARMTQLRMRATQQRFRDLQQAQEEATRRAVEEERSRIAGELHDVVTHNVSVMVIQAGAARMVMDTAPEQSKEALLAVEASGRAAMTELRHAMGLLAVSGTGTAAARTSGATANAAVGGGAAAYGTAATGSGSGAGSAAATPAARAELEPQPGLAQLTALIDRIRATGTPVSVALSPPPGPLPPGVDLAAYRVVQEALTNTLKHAVGARASVTIGHSGDWLEIEVSDTGGARGAGSGTGNGRGLIGMRERLAVYGGTLDAGRRLGGGYLIRARVPWRTA